MHESNSPDRRGFTLVELLVVLVILAILFTLATSAVMSFYGAGRARVTQTTLDLVKSMLERQWTTVADKANREQIPPAVEANANSLAAGDQLAGLRARVVYVKLRQRHAFPINFSDVFAPYLAGYAHKEYQAYLTKLGYTSNSASPAWPGADVQNAVCLKMILEIGPGGTGGNDSQLTGISKVLANVGTTEVRGLVDGSGKPLVFARNPTQFAALPTTPAPLDSADPQNLLGASTFPAGNRSLVQTAIGHTLPVTRKIRPVVASMGEDLALGVDPVTFATTNANDAADNKYTTDN